MKMKSLESKKKKINDKSLYKSIMLMNSKLKDDKNLKYEFSRIIKQWIWNCFGCYQHPFLLFKALLLVLLYGIYFF